MQKMTNDQSAMASIQARNLSKSVQTLMGICTGLTADNHLSDQEIHFLNAWLKDNTEVTQIWPGSEIAYRINTILHDEVITDDERTDLLDLLKKITGNHFLETGAAEAEIIGIDWDEIEIAFPDKIFCMTGQFLHGTRASCQRIIEKLGGGNTSNISRKVHYLIVGAMISKDWKYQSYGRKIEAAMQLKNESHSIAIVTEHQWVDAINALQNS